MLLWQDGQIWLDAYGKQNIETAVPMAENTLFRMASMTKPVTTVAVMMLVEEGKLRLDDPVEKHLPAFANLQVMNTDGNTQRPNRSVTIKDLLMHTGGIANNFFQNTPAEKAYSESFQKNRPTSLADLVDLLATLPLAHQPGEHWTYGFSTDVLGRIVEVTSGESLNNFFKRRIFQPLKMQDTDFQVPAEKLPRLAAAYHKGLKLADAATPDSPVANGKNYPRGAGGLVSTAHDYLGFCQMLLGGGELEGARLLKTETVRQMMTNQLPEGILPHSPGMPVICNGFGYGFGVQTDDAVFGSPGDCAWPGAYLTYFFIDPSHGGIGILLAQSTDFGNLPMLAEFHQLASRVFADGSPTEKKGGE